MTATMASTVNFGEQVYCTNLGQVPVDFFWNAKRYPLPPGKRVPVLFEAMTTFLGDPRSQMSITPFVVNGEKGFLPDRASEVRRIRAKWGNIGGDETQIENVPPILVESLDGDKIWTVAEDPSGEKMMAPDRPAEDLDARSLKAQLDYVQRQLAALEAGALARNPTDDIPFDTGQASTEEDDELPPDVEASPVTTLDGQATLSNLKFAADE